MRRPNLTTIGSFTTVVFKDKRRKLLGQGGQAVYGNSKKNNFFGSSEARKPVAFIGGANNDRYRLNAGQLAIVADLRGGDKDELDISGIDRARGQWGKVAIGNDVILTDLISGMAVLLHDPKGIDSKANEIEFIRAQFRDPISGVVNPRRSQTVPLSIWLDAATDFNTTLGIPAFNNYDEYNTALAQYRQVDAVGPGVLAGALAQQLPPQLAPLAGNLASLIKTLPNTGDLGLADHTAVLAAWQTATSNLNLLG